MAACESAACRAPARPPPWLPYGPEWVRTLGLAREPYPRVNAPNSHIRTGQRVYQVFCYSECHNSRYPREPDPAARRRWPRAPGVRLLITSSLKEVRGQKSEVRSQSRLPSPHGPEGTLCPLPLDGDFRVPARLGWKDMTSGSERLSRAGRG